jgi:hypothetical protein
MNAGVKRYSRSFIKTPFKAVTQTLATIDPLARASVSPGFAVVSVRVPPVRSS